MTESEKRNDYWQRQSKKNAKKQLSRLTKRRTRRSKRQLYTNVD